MKMAEPSKIGKAPEKQARRRWNCPDEARVSAYIDGSLGEAAGGKLARHLAKCSYCRELVAATVKLDRSMELPEVPAKLLQRARTAGESESKRWVWWWAPASSAAAALVCVGLMVAVWRAPQDLTIPKRPAPAGQAITKSEGATTGQAAPSEQERQPKRYEAEPTMITPQPGQALSRKSLKFDWNAIANAVSYQVRVVTPEGDLVWEGSSESTEVRVPDELKLKAGKYFVLVSATMDNGRNHKANPVEFQVVDGQ